MQTLLNIILRKKVIQNASIPNLTKLHIVFHRYTFHSRQDKAQMEEIELHAAEQNGDWK